MDIKHRFTGQVIYSDAGLTIADTLAAAARVGAHLGGADLGGVYLGGADLRGAFLHDAELSGADLRGAHLGGADLGGAFLSGAYLRGAFLRGAELRGADLRGADLRGAELHGADLRGADLRGARLNWQSHDLIAAILFGAAGKSVARRKVAGLIQMSRDWCWGQFLSLDDEEREWALATLAPWAESDAQAPPVFSALRSSRQ